MLPRRPRRRPNEPYQRRHPEVYSFDPDTLDPELQRALAAGRPQDAVSIHGPRLHILRVFRDEFLRRFDQEVASYEDWAAAHGRSIPPPNDMHDHGVPLDDLGFAPLLAGLRQHLVQPLAAALFPEFGGTDRLDHQHGFVVDYADDRDLDLDFHVDDAEITLNLCLSSDARGADLTFRGLRCAAHRQTEATPDELVRFTPEPGVAILHAGWHRHEVDLLERGRRRSLILWSQSNAFREREATARPGCRPWCPLHRS